MRHAPNPEQVFDMRLNETGERQLDALEREITIENLLGQHALNVGFSGLMESFRLGGTGNRHANKTDRLQQGIDSPLSMVVNTAYQGDGSEVYAKKRRVSSSPATLHTVIDAPPRYEALTGDYSANKISQYILSLTTRIGQIAGSPMDVYVRDGADDAGLSVEQSNSDAYVAFRQLEQDNRWPRVEPAEPNLKSQLDQVASRINEKTDVAFIAADFLDGYDKERGRFDWEEPLGRLHDSLGDRLWAVRLTSPAQTELPPHATKAIDFDVAQRINRDFADFKKKKQEALQSALSIFDEQDSSRTLVVDTLRANNEKHPVRAIGDFVLGEAS